MTGEVTIRGRVLPIGGLKEKLLAAKQAGVETVVIPERNLKDLNEVPTEIKSGIEVIACKEVEEVLKVALDLQNPEQFMKVVGLKVLKNNDPDSKSLTNQLNKSKHCGPSMTVFCALHREGSVYCVVKNVILD